MHTAHTGNLLALVLTFVLGPLLAVTASAQEAGNAPLRYARISTDDARVVNLPDANGLELARPERGTIVSVWRELAGWLEVEVPGGYLAWMHGRFLQPTDVEGVYEVTRNAINVRPLPKSDVTSFPLPQRLHSGDQVRVVALDDPKVAMSETWARIVTPPGVHAWIRSEQVKTLSASERGVDLWAAAVASTASPKGGATPSNDATPGSSSTSTPGSNAGTATNGATTTATGVEEATRTEIARLRTAIDAARESEAPDYTGLRDELQGLAATAPTGALRIEAEAELKRLSALEEVVRVRQELEAERERRAQEVWDRERGVREASRAKDPLGAVFRWRGVLLRNSTGSGTPSYTLRFGGRDVCEVVCTSGRYDLDLLAGTEVGIFGDENLAGSALGSLVDIRRLEVLKLR